MYPWMSAYSDKILILVNYFNSGTANQADIIRCLQFYSVHAGTLFLCLPTAFRSTVGATVPLVLDNPNSATSKISRIPHSYRKISIEGVYRSKESYSM